MQPWLASPSVVMFQDLSGFWQEKKRDIIGINASVSFSVFDSSTDFWASPMDVVQFFVFFHSRERGRVPGVSFWPFLPYGFYDLGQGTNVGAWPVTMYIHLHKNFRTREVTTGWACVPMVPTMGYQGRLHHSSLFWNEICTLTCGPCFGSSGISVSLGLVSSNPWKDYIFLFPQGAVTPVHGCRSLSERSGKRLWPL